MKLHLIDGRFETIDAIDIVTRLIQVKINFHEQKISELENEDDVKMREKRIRDLQKELYDLRKWSEKKKKSLLIQANIEIDE